MKNPIRKMIAVLGHSRSTTKVSVIYWLLLLSGCASLPSNFERTQTFAMSDTIDTSLGQKTERIVESNPGKSGFHALSEGINAFAARLSLVVHAEKTLDVQYYIWHDDLTGKLLHNQLLAAADRGVRVRLLLDDMDTAGRERCSAGLRRLSTLSGRPGQWWCRIV